MEKPNRNQNKPEIVEFFGKHLVAIAIKLICGNENREPVVTSMVIEVSNRWFLVTSAHWFRFIEELINSGFTYDSISLIDSLNCNAKDRHVIPFSNNDLHPILLDKIDEEVDIAIIPLRDYYINLLLRNGVESLNELTWKELPRETDACWIFGLPSELQRVRESGFTLSTIGFPVNLEIAKPEKIPERKYSRVYGKIELGTVIYSIKGMSGAPLFVFHDKRYWLYAIQTSWWPDSQIIEAIPIIDLCLGIEKHYMNN